MENRKQELRNALQAHANGWVTWPVEELKAMRKELAKLQPLVIR